MDMSSIKSLLGTDKLANIIVPVLLFIILSPGMLLTIPKSSNGYFLSQQTSIPAVIVHALVFLVVYTVLRKIYKEYY